jgi:glycine/sarcosine/betaine reductase complex component A
MDLEDQGRIKELVEAYGKDAIVVLLGAPTTDSSQIQFETVTTGDPSYAGPLAGVELGLEAYHVFEPFVKAAIEPEQYAELIETLEMGLESDEIVSKLAEIRNGVVSGQ